MSDPAKDEITDLIDTVGLFLQRKSTIGQLRKAYKTLKRGINNASTKERSTG